ncbi:hypothetical protein MASR2M70_12800 [Bacillota bacterium]
MLDFKEVTLQTNILAVGQALGLDIKNGFCLCPFHNEKTRSLKFYEDHFYCFGCHAHGDAIQLVANVNGCSLVDAASWIISTFNLRIEPTPYNAPPIASKKKIIANTTDVFVEWYRNANEILCCYSRICYDVANMLHVDEGIRHIAEVEAERMEVLLDTLITLSPKESYFKYKKEVEKIATKLHRKFNFA